MRGRCFENTSILGGENKMSLAQTPYNFMPIYGERRYGDVCMTIFGDEGSLHAHIWKMNTFE